MYYSLYIPDSLQKEKIIRTTAKGHEVAMGIKKKMSGLMEQCQVGFRLF